MIIDDYDGDNFDHSGLGFVGGGYMGMWQTNPRPIETRPVPAGTPKWGAQWDIPTSASLRIAARLFLTANVSRLAGRTAQLFKAVVVGLDIVIAKRPILDRHVGGQRRSLP